MTRQGCVLVGLVLMVAGVDGSRTKTTTSKKKRPSAYAPESNIISKGALQAAAGIAGAMESSGPICVDSLGQTEVGSTIGAYTCHGTGGNQAWLYTTDHQIRKAIVVEAEGMDHEMVVDYHECLDAASPAEDPQKLPRDVKIWACHGKGGNQLWFHRWDDSTVRHIIDDSTGCLEVYDKGQGAAGLRVGLCDGSPGQKWHWHGIRKKLNDEL